MLWVLIKVNPTYRPRLSSIYRKNHKRYCITTIIQRLKRSRNDEYSKISASSSLNTLQVPNQTTLLASHRVPRIRGRNLDEHVKLSSHVAGPRTLFREATPEVLQAPNIYFSRASTTSEKKDLNRCSDVGTSCFCVLLCTQLTRCVVLYT